MKEESQKSVINKAVARFILSGIIIALAIFVPRLIPEEKVDYEVKVIAPTCESEGYSLYKNPKTEKTEIRDLVAALGHSYSEWEILCEAEGLATGERERVCTVCDTVETEIIYPKLEIGRIGIVGDLTEIGKKAEVDVLVDLNTKEHELSCWGRLKYQGHSTLEYSKKNYTLKLFKDEERSEKYKITFSHWRKENKYILKANYMDSSHSRNLVSADIWADMVSSREMVSEELKTLSNYGAVDGFPIALYINGDFVGLYTMNLHKDDDLFGMKDGEEHAIMIVNHADDEEGFFRAEAVFDDETAWEVEYCGTEEIQWSKEKLNEFISFVRNSSDDEFVAGLDEYIDVNSAIDYLIAMYALDLTEHAAKDLILVAWSADSPWVCSMYDMEEAFSGDGVVPVKEGNVWRSGTDSLLWDRVMKLYYPQICQRYVGLRDNVLDEELLCERIDAFINQIPEGLYKEDARVNDMQEFTVQQAEEMKVNICHQLMLLDQVLMIEGE